MGKVYKCDVCGKIEKNRTTRVDLKTTERALGGQVVFIRPPYYLCSKCINKLNAWLNEGGELNE